MGTNPFFGLLLQNEAIQLRPRGKIADDQTAHTLQQYIGGVDFGIPGTPKADKIAIEKLLPNRLKDQFCFRTQDAVNHLEYIRSDRYGDVKL